MQDAAHVRAELAALRIIDTDAHITEPPDLWTSRAPASYRERLPRVKDVEGTPSWVVGENIVLGPVIASSVVQKGGAKARGPEFFRWRHEDVHVASYDMKARVGRARRARPLRPGDLPEPRGLRKPELPQGRRQRPAPPVRAHLQRRDGRVPARDREPHPPDGAHALVEHRRLREGDRAQRGARPARDRDVQRSGFDRHARSRRRRLVAGLGALQRPARPGELPHRGEPDLLQHVRARLLAEHGAGAGASRSARPASSWRTRGCSGT